MERFVNFCFLVNKKSKGISSIEKKEHSHKQKEQCCKLNQDTLH